MAGPTGLNYAAEAKKLQEGDVHNAGDSVEREEGSMSIGETSIGRLQTLLEKMPEPCNKYVVRRSIGQGTFSTVYLAESKEENSSPVAIKHLVPTASPERILVEVECLRIAGGEKNVISLLFCHRLKGDVILAMPYIKQKKFSLVLKTITYQQMVTYMKNLLVALEHIHTVGIIHRDIKPANFLFDFETGQFGLVDFGLAQMTGTVSTKPHESPLCKMKLPYGDDANASDEASSPVKKQTRVALANRTSEINVGDPVPPEQKTPSKNYGSNPAWDHYNKRGSLRKKKTAQSKLEQYFAEVKPKAVVKPDYSHVKTPKKNKVVQSMATEVRRSPRKHHTVSRKATGFSKLTISGSSIVGVPNSAVIKRTPSFTMLDPTSGLPSDYTPRLQASLTSRSRHDMNPLSRFNTPTFSNLIRCDCFGLPTVCHKCLSRQSQKVARAGTPGFRPPEVLLKFEHQTTAIDVWAAGVIMLCIMSRTYPFFRAPDDVTALGELICVFGSEKVKELACQYGKKFLCSEHRSAVDLQELCRKLAQRPGSEAGLDNLATTEAADLLSNLLNPLSNDRISAATALKHPFFLQE